MIKCTKCGYVFPGEVCPACGARACAEKKTPLQKPPEEHIAPEQSKVTTESIVDVRRNPLFMKYVDFLDDAALYNVACCHAEGAGGVEQDVEQAVEMFQILAFRGHFGGMYKLAEYYLSLDPPDKQTAVQWLCIAADGGHEPSKTRLRIIGEEAARRPAFSGPMEVPEGSFEARVKNALPCVVMVHSTYQKGKKTSSSCGSGFILEGGFVVTNAHVVGENPKSVTAYFEPSVDDKSYNLLPLAIAPEFDVAILRFTGLADERISARENLRLRVDDVRYGEEVYTIGNPLGLRFSVSRGVVSTPLRKDGHRIGIHEVIQTDITANHGNSGGALFDISNNVLGMITYSPSRSEGGISMCVPSKYIVQVLNKLGESYKRN